MCVHWATNKIINRRTKTHTFIRYNNGDDKLRYGWQLNRSLHANYLLLRYLRMERVFCLHLNVLPISWKYDLFCCQVITTALVLICLNFCDCEDVLMSNREKYELNLIRIFYSSICVGIETFLSHTSHSIIKYSSKKQLCCNGRKHSQRMRIDLVRNLQRR